MSNESNIPNLASCPDCHAGISPSAEWCPHCGSPFAKHPVVVIPGPRWSWTVYWGLVLFVLIPIAISAAVTAIMFIIFVGALSTQQLKP